MADTGVTQAFPVLPVPGGVVFPGTVVTLLLEGDEARQAVEAARSGDGRLLLVPTVDGRTARVGVLGTVEQLGELPGGGRAAIVRGVERARLGQGVVGSQPGLWVQASPALDGLPDGRAVELGRELRVVLEEVAGARRSRRLPELLRTVSDPGALADAATAWAERSPAEQLDVLEAVDLVPRLELVLGWARELLAVARLDEQIRSDVNEQLAKQQREHLLRQQLAAIRRELGDDSDDPVAEYRERAAGLPEPARATVEKEIDRLERTSGQSPEQGWIRSWLDRVLELPWGLRTDDVADLRAARAVLDADHHGLDEVKDRILELLAVRQLRRERKADERSGGRGDGAILVLVGPPGVGKTSLGESVARAMGRRFVRVALGGVRDEAEIRGHRRTYVGSQPGRIVRAMAEAGSMNPVVLLDEVDKLSPGGWSGDPTAALLEVLDPAQNHTFRDHYLEVELDLSDVVFLATANVAEAIPAPLLDRMEVVRLDGYTEDEKVFIARHHLLPRQLERAGLLGTDVVVDDEALRRIVVDYTREAGVRNLERELARVLRKVATEVATGGAVATEVATGGAVATEVATGGAVATEVATAGVPVLVGAQDVRQWLGRPRFFEEQGERALVPGVATGLAVTGVGGDVLQVEASSWAGEPGLVLTGQLGDVMKESAQIALSYVRSNAERLGIDPVEVDRRFHVHVPAGAVPKDGPSAGITMTAALVSLLSGRPVKASVGMTGEITLQGRVLPIGGVKQKVLAAHRAGLTEVVLPRRNGPDLDDVPERVREAMTFHLADSFDDVVAAALA